jgi:serine/threonine protein kinase
MTIHQVGEENDLPFIVMQRLDGCTLTEYRERTGRVPVAEALRIGREAAEGLAAAHKLGLVHRDIKPDNIFLVGPKRLVKIIDFGLARDAAEDGAKLTVDGAVVGTPAYMSPERIGEQEIDARGDVFGLGVILYELLSNRLPFEGKSMVSVLASISRGDPPQLRVIAPDVPEAVCNLVMRMMAHDKKDRPKTAADVADELAALERARK